jgi:hypothetical protein
MFCGKFTSSFRPLLLAPSAEDRDDNRRGFTIFLLCVFNSTALSIIQHHLHNHTPHSLLSIIPINTTNPQLSPEPTPRAGQRKLGSAKPPRTQPPLPHTDGHATGRTTGAQISLCFASLCNFHCFDRFASAPAARTWTDWPDHRTSIFSFTTNTASPDLHYLFSRSSVTLGVYNLPAGCLTLKGLIGKANSQPLRMIRSTLPNYRHYHRSRRAGFSSIELPRD